MFPKHFQDEKTFGDGYIIVIFFFSYVSQFSMLLGLFFSQAAQQDHAPSQKHGVRYSQRKETKGWVASEQRIKKKKRLENIF